MMMEEQKQKGSPGFIYENYAFVPMPPTTLTTTHNNTILLYTHIHTHTGPQILYLKHLEPSAFKP
jgi:hypothetical protein